MSRQRKWTDPTVGTAYTLYIRAKAAAKHQDSGSIQAGGWKAKWAHDEQTYSELARTQITLTCSLPMSKEERVELAIFFAQRKTPILRWEDGDRGTELHFLVKTGPEKVQVPIQTVNVRNRFMVVTL